MADIKSVVVTVPDLSEDGGPGCGLVLKSGAVFSAYEAGPFVGLSEADLRSAQALSLEAALEGIKAGKDIQFLGLSGAGFGARLGELIELSDRRTVLAVAGPDRLAFFGFGISASAGAECGPARAADVLPTLAMIGEFYLDGAVEGLVLFGALKNPSFKQTQVAKLKAALARLEKMLKRENREPWDKHDCA